MLWRGNKHSNVVILGEAPGEQEELYDKPFIGQSGQELDQMAAEAGFNTNDCFVTNVCHKRPPWNEISNFFTRQGPTEPIIEGLDELDRWMKENKPRLIIALGNTALWAVAKDNAGFLNRQGAPAGITSWRGSVIETKWPGTKAIATYHPAAILRQWSWRHVGVQDLRRARKEMEYDGIRQPTFHFLVRPSCGLVLDYLVALRSLASEGRVEVVCDIETRNGQIACLGLATSERLSLCIPFQCLERDEGFFSEGEEREIVIALRETLQTPQLTAIFHNSLFDLQYMAKQWGFIPTNVEDTMVMQHVAYPGLPKSLAFCASLYCNDYRFWKEDGKKWDPRIHSEDQLWSYNCEDCVRTYECSKVLRGILETYGLVEQYNFQSNLVLPALKMMLRGVRVDLSMKARVGHELDLAMQDRKEWFRAILGHPFNPRSSKQMKDLFYEDFRCRERRNRKTGNISLDEEALQSIKRNYPLLRPLVERIEEYRSLGVFKSNYAEMSLDTDDRARSSINLAGTETYRWSMSENAFGTGGNLQTIPSGREE